MVDVAAAVWNGERKKVEDLFAGVLDVFHFPSKVVDSYFSIAMGLDIAFSAKVAYKSKPYCLKLLAFSNETFLLVSNNGISITIISIKK